jgi:hypothetical protein
VALKGPLHQSQRSDRHRAPPACHHRSLPTPSRNSGVGVGGRSAGKKEGGWGLSASPRAPARRSPYRWTTAPVSPKYPKHLWGGSRFQAGPRWEGSVVLEVVGAKEAHPPGRRDSGACNKRSVLLLWCGSVARASWVDPPARCDSRSRVRVPIHLKTTREGGCQPSVGS